MRRAALIAVVLAGCGGGTKGICKDMCKELYVGCDYAAFPSFDSCEQGCAYDAEQGADVEGQLACVEAAECNTFEIVECQHEFGP